MSAGSDHADREPVSRKRPTRESDSSDYTSPQISSFLKVKKARSFFHETENKKVKKFESTDILCLYPKDSYFGAYPCYIRYIKQHPSPVNTIVETVTVNLEQLHENSEVDFRAFGLPTLDEKEKKMEDCIFGCAEIFLGDLQCDAGDKWIDTSNLGRKERRERCLAIAKNCGISDDIVILIMPDFTLLYEAFLNGFSNGFGILAIERLFRICLLILENSGYHFVMNLGGSSTRFPGNSTTLQVYSTSSGKPTKEEAEMELSLEMAEVKVWVPDILVYTHKIFSDEKIYYFFAECKSGHAAKKSLYHQLWHESLRGLIDSDVVYSCGMCSSFMTLCKSYLEDGVLETRIISMWFWKTNASMKKRSFDIINFKKFIQYMTKAIQDQNNILS